MTGAERKKKEKSTLLYLSAPKTPSSHSLKEPSTPGSVCNFYAETDIDLSGGEYGHATEGSGESSYLRPVTWPLRREE